MRLNLFVLALAASFVSPIVAYADTMDTFTITDSTGTITFDIAGSPDIESPNILAPQDFGIKNVAYTGSASGSGDFYFDIFGDVAGPDPEGSSVYYNGSLPTFSGVPATPTFTIGTYHLDGGSVTLTIADATSPVPEPSSMLLLSTGLLGLGSVVRRRFV